MAVESPDGQLLALLTQDSEALEAFYRRHVAPVTRFLARRCATPEDLADAVAQTFVEVITSAPRFDSRRGNPTAWLFGIASHCVSAQWRARRRDRALSAAVSGRRLLEEDDYERLEQQIDAARLAPSLTKALASLNGKDRELLELVDIDELSPTQAARLLGVQPAAARVRLARARRRLRVAFTQEHEAASVVPLQGGGR
jgi:RNA polymerase sigma-70 factor (ECF subfamily)